MKNCKTIVALALAVAVLACASAVIGGAQTIPDRLLIAEEGADPVDIEGVVYGLLGDADESGVINVRDATVIQKYSADLQVLTERQMILADVNFSDNVNVRDSTAIQKWTAFIPVELSINRYVYKPVQQTTTTSTAATQDSTPLPIYTTVPSSTTLPPIATTSVPRPTERYGSISCDTTIYYGISVGDVVTYTIELTTPVIAENIQVTISYDPGMLRLESDSESDRFPILSAGSNVSAKSFDDGRFSFNAINVDSGFDFIDGRKLAVLRFTVLDDNAPRLSQRIDDMDAVGGTQLVVSGEVQLPGVVFHASIEAESIFDTSPYEENVSSTPLPIASAVPTAPLPTATDPRED